MQKGQHQDNQAEKKIANKGMDAPSSSLPYRGELEKLIGQDLSGVSVHTGEKAKQSAEQLGAHAYITRGHIVLGDRNDQKTVAEKAVHALQQKDSTTSAGLSKGITDGREAAEEEAKTASSHVLNSMRIPHIKHGLDFSAIARSEKSASYNLMGSTIDTVAQSKVLSNTTESEYEGVFSA